MSTHDQYQMAGFSGMDRFDYGVLMGVGAVAFFAGHVHSLWPAIVVLVLLIASVVTLATRMLNRMRANRYFTPRTVGQGALKPVVETEEQRLARLFKLVPGAFWLDPNLWGAQPAKNVQAIHVPIENSPSILTPPQLSLLKRIIGPQGVDGPPGVSISGPPGASGQPGFSVTDCYGVRTKLHWADRCKRCGHSKVGREPYTGYWACMKCGEWE